MKLKDMKFGIKDVDNNRWVSAYSENMVSHEVTNIFTTNEFILLKYDFNTIKEILKYMNNINSIALYTEEDCDGYKKQSLVAGKNIVSKLDPSDMVQYILSTSFNENEEFEPIYKNKETEGDIIMNEPEYTIKIKTKCTNWEFIGYEGQYAYYPRKKYIDDARKFSRNEVDGHVGKILGYCINLEPIDIRITRYKENIWEISIRTKTINRDVQLSK